MHMPGQWAVWGITGWMDWSLSAIVFIFLLNQWQHGVFPAIVTVLTGVATCGWNLFPLDNTRQTADLNSSELNHAVMATGPQSKWHVKQVISAAWPVTKFWMSCWRTALSCCRATPFRGSQFYWCLVRLEGDKSFLCHHSPVELRVT